MCPSKFEAMAATSLPSTLPPACRDPNAHILCRTQPPWSVVEHGTAGQKDHRLLLLDGQGRHVSPWHGVSLYAASNLVHMTCKTPRGSSAAYEVAPDEELQPLRPRRSNPNFRRACPWNLGLLPQTWASAAAQGHGGLPYDGRPLEVVEIGRRTAQRGRPYAVRLLGTFALVEEEGPRISWKVLAIAVDDVMADKLRSVESVSREMPGTLEHVREWLRTCECLGPGDKFRKFGFNERAVEGQILSTLVSQTHTSWHALPHHRKPLSPTSLSPTYLSSTSLSPTYLSSTSLSPSSPSPSPLPPSPLPPAVAYTEAWNAQKLHLKKHPAVPLSPSSTEAAHTNFPKQKKEAECGSTIVRENNIMLGGAESGNSTPGREERLRWPAFFRVHVNSVTELKLNTEIGADAAGRQRNHEKNGESFSFMRKVFKLPFRLGRSAGDRGGRTSGPVGGRILRASSVPEKVLQGISHGFQEADLGAFRRWNSDDDNLRSSMSKGRRRSLSALSPPSSLEGDSLEESKGESLKESREDEVGGGAEVREEERDGDGGLMEKEKSLKVTEDMAMAMDSFSTLGVEETSGNHVPSLSGSDQFVRVKESPSIASSEERNSSSESLEGSSMAADRSSKESEKEKEESHVEAELPTEVEEDLVLDDEIPIARVVEGDFPPPPPPPFDSKGPKGGRQVSFNNIVQVLTFNPSHEEIPLAAPVTSTAPPSIIPFPRAGGESKENNMRKPKVNEKSFGGGPTHFPSSWPPAAASAAKGHPHKGHIVLMSRNGAPQRVGGGGKTWTQEGFLPPKPPIPPKAQEFPRASSPRSSLSPTNVPSGESLLWKQMQGQGQFSGQAKPRLSPRGIDSGSRKLVIKTALKRAEGGLGFQGASDIGWVEERPSLGLLPFVEDSDLYSCSASEESSPRSPESPSPLTLSPRNSSHGMAAVHPIAFAAVSGFALPGMAGL